MPRTAISVSFWVFLVVPLCALSMTACTTTADRPATPTPASEEDALRSAPVEPFPRVSLSLDEPTLGGAVRAMAERHGGSLAVMNGLETRPLGRVSLNQVAFDRVVEGWAREVNGAIQKTPNYYFLYPSGFEVLTQLSLVERLHPRYDDIREPIIFGAGMRLFTLGKWMSEALSITIVMDQVIGDANCGEITMGSVPLTASIEALLKSARIPEVQIDSTEDYIFIAQPGAWLGRPTLLNEGALTQRQREYLEQRLTLRLPNASRDWPSAELALGAQPLGELLDTLSQQLGITVVADAAVRSLPVNPMVMHDVTVRTALDLLIWQWPVPEFGYHFASDRIVLREMTTAEIVAQREAYFESAR